MSDFTFSIPWKDGSLTSLAFADDIALLADQSQKMQVKTNNHKTCADTVSLQIHVHKTKIQVIHDGINADVKMDNSTLEALDRFMYLDSIQASDGGTDPDLKARLRKGLNVYKRLQPVWYLHGISLKTKLKLYETLVLSIALYMKHK